MRIDFTIKKLCPHCKHDSLQTYLAHHVYDEKQRDLWDGDPETAKEPAAYFVFACRTCGEVLLYHFQAIDEMECEDLFPVIQNQVKKMPWDQEDISLRLQLMWPSTTVTQPKPKLSIDEQLYRQEICPYCPRAARQRLLYAANEFPESYVEKGKVVLIVMLETMSLFRCEGCKATLVYKTVSDDLEGPELVDQKKPEWIIELDEDEFCQNSILLCALPYSKQPNLDPGTPAAVKNCHEIGIKVRPFSKDLYALQLRKALEAVCKDKGAADHLASGRRTMLWQQIDELKNHNVVGEFISNAAHQLKDISNTGAHYSEHEVTDTDIRKLEHLLAYYNLRIRGRENIDRI
jgi:hypothetical protein